MSAMTAGTFNSLSPNGFIVGGEGWGEGALLLDLASTPSPNPLPRHGQGRRLEHGVAA